MYEFHKDKKRYFEWQRQVGQNHIQPFISAQGPIMPGAKVLEIGCAQAGVLKSFIDAGFQGTGIELSPKWVVLAKEFLAEEIQEGRAQIINKNIYDIDTSQEPDLVFDIIILKDVIEHIFHQEKFMQHMHKLLRPRGRVFFGFPPWQMPFGGHQQICQSRALKYLPFFHLLPKGIYKLIFKVFGEKPKKIQELLEIKETGLSIERFEKICDQAGYQILHKTHFLINPVYAFKFGLKPREQLGLISAIPYLRNFMTTAVYYLIAQKE